MILFVGSEDSHSATLELEATESTGKGSNCES